MCIPCKSPLASPPTTSPSITARTAWHKQQQPFALTQCSQPSRRQYAKMRSKTQASCNLNPGPLPSPSSLPYFLAFGCGQRSVHFLFEFSHHCVLVFTHANNPWFLLEPPSSLLARGPPSASSPNASIIYVGDFPPRHASIRSIGIYSLSIIT